MEHVQLPEGILSPSLLAVTTKKFDKYLMLHVQISAPDVEWKNFSKHVER
jgi:hypothetical protein